MKKVGVVDIHPNSPMCGPYPSSQETNQYEDDQSLIHLFNITRDGCTCETTLDYVSQKDWMGIDEFYVSLPAAILDFRILNFPFCDKEKITKAIPLELDDYIIGGAEEIVFDSINLGGDDTSVEVLVAYARKEVLNHVLTQLARKNIDPRVITSIDVQTVIKTGEGPDREGFRGSIAENLIGLHTWDQNQRIIAAENEITQPTINLRIGQFAYRKDAEKTGKALRGTVILAFLLALVIHASMMFQAIMIKKDLTTITSDMRGSYSSLFPSDKKTIDVLNQLKSHIREIEEKNDTLIGIATLKFLMDLSKRRESYIVYTDIQIEKNLIKMKAETSSMDDLSKIKMKLSEFLPDVSISDVKSTAHGKIIFTVIAKGQSL
jgi:Type II secretory pathway, component PulL